MDMLLNSVKVRLLSLILAVMMTLGLYAPASVEITGAPEKSGNAVRVVSFNLRCKDDVYGKVENRGRFISAALRNYAPDSFGVQEATEKWLSILDSELGESYARVGVGRDSSKNTEYSAVFYLRDKFDLVDEGTIWLSETPQVAGSKSFCSSMPRICTWATLRNRQTGEVYTHINTHLDHLLERARAGQADVLLAKVGELANYGPVVCTGDFNADEESKTYAKMTAVLDDSRIVAKASESGKTFHNYGRGDIVNKTAIDFIFVSKGTEVEQYKIIRDTVENMYLSDHYGIMADICF